MFFECDLVYYLFFVFFFLMIRRPPRSTHCISSAASDVYKRQVNIFSVFPLLNFHCRWQVKTSYIFDINSLPTFWQGWQLQCLSNAKLNCKNKYSQYCNCFFHLLYFVIVVILISYQIDNYTNRYQNYVKYWISYFSFC
eukprot:TRINITY_DN31842_c0_g1_i2.p1 TRINITY_DN31842_c0_g1~~TRINITY_DN31842_c0_g1_i2.p1  ORF type:complete len:139 (+),score=13.54 TRINITY_DN31842_c0_g1_i2:73-489(+)